MNIIIKPRTFRDVTGKNNDPAATMDNAVTALGLLGVECRYDVFHDKKLIGGQVLGSEIGQLSDDVCLLVRKLCRENLKFDPGKEHTWDAINLVCRLNSFNPILDYLDGLKWDGVERIGTWMRDYMLAPDTDFVRAVSEMMLIASVRRVRQPGCKFDYMCVLESPEGKNKSRGLALLYGDENFSDQSILNLTDKEMQEAFRGRWCIEAADLSGMRKADVEKLKAQLSRRSDRARPAYGRAVIDIPRTAIPWGTTNDEDYLRSQTGNRRILPVPVGRIDIARLATDRDQLWAEASIAEALDMEIMLPENLWGSAKIEQDARTQREPWIDILHNAAGLAQSYEQDKALDDDARKLGVVYQNKDNEERITSQFCLAKILKIADGQQTPEHSKRLGNAMRKLGWIGPVTMRIGGRAVKGYWRGDPAA